MIDEKKQTAIVEMLQIQKLDYPGIEDTEILELRKPFEPIVLNFIKEIESIDKILGETNITKDLSKNAKEKRLSIRKFRTEAEDKKTIGKDLILKKGNIIQHFFNKIKEKVGEYEDKLENIEKHFENLEKERKEKLNIERQEKVKIFLEKLNIEKIFLGEKSDTDFDIYVNSLKTILEDKEEKERLENEKKELEIKKREIYHNRQIILAPFQEFLFGENFLLGLETLESEFLEILEILKSKKIKKDIEIENQKIENEKLKKEAEEKEKELEIEREKAKKEAEEREKLEREKAEKLRLENLEKERLELENQKKSNLEKQEKYKKFLEKNGYNENNKNDYKVENNGNSIILYKKIDTFIYN